MSSFRRSPPVARSARPRPHAWAISLGMLAGATASLPAAAQTDNRSTVSQASDPSTSGAMLAPVVVQERTEPGLVLSQPASTGSRMGLTPLETPASIDVLTGDTIRARGDQSVREAVVRTAGMTSNAAPGNGGTALVARGFAGHGSVMQLYDGTRLYVASGTVTFPFDTWSAERIEVLRGPASVMFGEGAIGGVINVVPKKPFRGPIENEMQVTGGTESTARLAVDSGGGINDMLSYRFNANAGRTDGWVDRGDARTAMVSAAIRLDATPTLNFTLSHDDGYQRPMHYFGTPLVRGALDESLRKKNYNVGDAEVRYRDRWTRLVTEWQPNERVTVRDQLYYLTSDRHWRNAETYTYLPASGQVRRGDYLEILHDQEQIGNRADMTVKGSLFGLSNTATVGFDVNRIHFTHTNNSPYGGTSTVNARNFDPGQFFSPPGVTTSPRLRSHTTQYALFAENKLDLTQAWSVIGGVRFDHAELERINLPAGTGFRKTFANTTWRAGTVYRFTHDLSVYAQYATATDPLGALITTSDAQRDYQLATGRQVEVGLKQAFWDKRGEWTFAAYEIRKKNLLSRDPSNPAFTIQVGEQSSRGLEASVSMELVRGLRLDANGALLRAQYDDFAESVGGQRVSRNGNVPTGVPEHTANAWLTWSFAPQWTTGAGLRYVGKRYANTANTVGVPASTVVDAMLQWRVTRSTALTLRVFNLFDRRYAEVATNGGNQWLLGRPRAAELTANFRF